MAFHPYPQLIPQFFNIGGFGPPRGLTRASPWPWVDHSASGLECATESPYSDSLSLRLRFNSLTSPHTANSQAHSSKGTLSQGSKSLLQRIVSKWFQVLFHSPPGVLFIFPSRYLSAIGHQGVFRLSGWSRQIHTRFLGPRATWDIARECMTFRLRGSYPLCRPFRMAFNYAMNFLLLEGLVAPSEQSHNTAYATPTSYHAYAVWPLPLSLATTNGITFVVSSCGY